MKKEKNKITQPKLPTAEKKKFDKKIAQLQGKRFDSLQDFIQLLDKIE